MKVTKLVQIVLNAYEWLLALYCMHMRIHNKCTYQAWKHKSWNANQQRGDVECPTHDHGNQIEDEVASNPRRLKYGLVFIAGVLVHMREIY